ncbi:MAG: response regulator, partial [Burkholderiaceae bacterium]
MDRPLILVVDDESKIRRLIAANLETLGFDVCAAGDGEQALEVFRTCSPPPDLVILDLMMPGLDGLAALERLRAQSDVPVILVTARNEGQDKM